MVKKLNLTLLLLSIFLISSLNAQNSNCNVPNKIANGKLAMEMEGYQLSSGSWGIFKTYFKMPTTSTEVNNADWINCKGYLPNGAKIKSIEILSITGLPKGLKWSCDNDNCFYDGSESGCVTIEGTPQQKGIYQIEIQLKGVGSIWGIKKSYDCFIKTVEITID